MGGDRAQRVGPAARPGPSMSRRRALGLLAGAGGLLALSPGRARALVIPGPVQHPEPRPGIDASAVLPPERVAPHAAELYDHIREIPHVVDGIRCQCGCADLPGFYSLLSCYESEGMARWCEICQGEGRLVSRLHKAGKTLDDIRAAIDARFG
jgi:hypothetical protein